MALSEVRGCVMVKRPSFQLAPEVIEQAIALRRKGLTIREIAAETGASKSAIQVALAEAEKAGLLSRGGPGAAPENVDLADDLDDECRGWLLVSKKARADIQERIKAGDRLDLKEAEKALAMAERAKKLSELLRGRVTSRSESVRQPPEPEPTPEEKAEMERLDRLWNKANLQ